MEESRDGLSLHLPLDRETRPLILFALLLAADVGQAERERHFETAVRPVLVERCQKCHGPEKQNGGLRLDALEHVLRGGDSGPALAPGKPSASLLLKAIQRHPDLSAMPPNEPLPPAAVTAIEQWIRQGAVWPKTFTAVGVGDAAAIAKLTRQHWAFQPVQNTAPPRVRKSDWPRSSMDAFVLAKLEAAGLRPAPDADRATLLRRVTFDLIGLPPTPAECESFLNDPDPTPLAFAKVVDRLLASPGYGERWGRHWLDVARYADTKGYVFQEERRYPFSYTYRDWVVRALNDDLPYNEFIKYQVAADRFASKDDPHLAAMGFLTVGRRFLQDQQEITDDRIDVVTRGVLGLTVSCARCHDHKYDPISMADYYGLYGVFASSEEPKDLPVLASGAEGQRVDYEKRLQEKSAAVAKFLDEQHAAVQKRLLDDTEKLLKLALLAEKDGPQKAAESARQQGVSPGAFRRWSERWTQCVTAGRKASDGVFVAWAELGAIPAPEFSAKAPEVVKKLLASTKSPLPVGLKSKLEKPLASKDDVAVRFAEFVREASKSPKAGEAFPQLFGANGAFVVVKTDAQQYFDRRQRERFRALERSVEELKVQHPGAEARAMVMVDKPQPVEQRVFLRGNPGRPGPVAPRAFLTVLSERDRKPFKEGSGRKELAEALVRPTNPLTARVIVNRVWQWRFGKGLVSSPSDFGLRSDPPSHPELLDHLASEFVADGWSLKKLHRRMLLSHVYQQSSTGAPDLLSKDPENKLLGRFPRLRLEWEAMRDSALAVSGRLDRRVGGRPIPLFNEPYPRRRTLYGFIDRQNLDGAFRTFDFATPDASSPQRFVTTVPQQGLFLLNSRFLIDEASAFAARPEWESSPTAERIGRMIQAAFGRAAERREIELVQKYLASQPDWTPNPKQAWVRFAQALLMSNEFHYID